MRHGRSPSRFLIELLAIVLATEAAIMVALPALFPGLDGIALATVDALLLTIIAGPIIAWRIGAGELRSVNDAATNGMLSPVGRRVAIVVVCMGVPVSLTVGHALMRSNERTAETRFDGLLTHAGATVKEWTERPMYLLHATRGLFGASQQVEPVEFQRFVDYRNLAEEFPGLGVAGLIRRVDDTELPAFEASLQASLGESFTIPSMPGADTHWIVECATPEPMSLPLTGANLASFPGAIDAIETALTLDRPVISPLLELPGCRPGDREALWVLPVYRRGAATDTADARRTALEAVVFATFSPQSIAPPLDRLLGASVQLALTESDPAYASDQILSLADDAHDGRFSRTIPVTVGERTWQLHATSTAAFDDSISLAVPLLVVVGGTALSIALAGIFFSLSSAQRRGEAIADRMTREVRRLSVVAESTTNAVIITDADERIEWVNEGFTRITGYTFDEAIGQRPAPLLQCDDTDDTTRQRIRAALERREGFRGEILNRGKDGRVYWLDLDIQPIIDDDRNLSGFIAVETDLTDHKNAERALQEAKLAAERATEAKSRFLASMSHEIRTPLNGIIGFAELLRRGADSDDAQRAEWLQVIHASGEHLLSLLNDVLDLAKLESDEADLAVGPCAARQVIGDSVALLRSRASEKGIGLDVVFDESAPSTLRTDATRVRQVVMNLVANAVKFTSAGGVKVVVRGDDHDGAPALRIIVSDTGIGMTPDHVARLFTPFRQADKTIADRFGGTGLGLAISKHLVERLGGCIEVSSQLGIGSTFTVTIAAPPLRPGETVDDRTADDADWSGPDPTGRLPLEGCRILIADDIETNRNVCSLFLERAGAEVHAVANGFEAVEACGGGDAFDLVLMDVQMPGMNGIDAAARIRGAGACMPILALTAFSSGSDRSTCIDSGMNDFLAKPIQPALLVQTCARWIAQSASRALLQAPDGPDELSIENDATLRSIALAWLAELPDRLDAVRRAVDGGDWDAVARIGHALKGTGGTVGLPEFGVLAHDVERAALMEHADGVSRLLEELRTLQERTATRLANEPPAAPARPTP